MTHFTEVTCLALKKERWHSATWPCCSRENSRRRSIIRGSKGVDRARLSYTAVKFNCSIWTQGHICRYPSCRQNSTRTVSNLRCLAILLPAVLFLTSYLDTSIDRRETKLHTRTIFYSLIQTNMAISITTTTWVFHLMRILTCHPHTDLTVPIEDHK